MANEFAFLNFESTTIELGGHKLFATDGTIDIKPNLGEGRVYGEFNPEICGTKTKMHRQAPLSPMEGTLNVNFYITKEFFDAVLGLNELFDVENVSELPIKNNRIGRYVLGDLYLQSFRFSMTPFGVIKASAGYIMTGTMYRVRPSYQMTTGDIKEFDPAHALRSFALVKAGGRNLQDDDFLRSGGNAQDYVFEITSLEYNINVERRTSGLIRSNENSIINTKAEGATVSRVSVNNMYSDMKITSNDLVDRLNPYGDHQVGTTPFGIEDASITAYLYSINGERLSKFKSTGKIEMQSLQVNKDGMTTANISVKQIIR